MQNSRHFKTPGTEIMHPPATNFSTVPISENFEVVSQLLGTFWRLLWNEMRVR